jgi:hypothetical protein
MTNMPAALGGCEFDSAPTLHFGGSLKIGDPLATDLHFEVAGERFHWGLVQADKVSGNIDWLGRTVSLTNVMASLYGPGKLSGWAKFNYAPKQGTDFNFEFSAIDIDLPVAAQSLGTKTNHLEGLIDAQLAMFGNSHHKNSWQGHGRASLRDGLIWDIPIFGIFSPLLNAIVPGAGNSRARNAEAAFIIKNGAIYTDDLEIRALGFRLLYRGSIDFNKQVDARAEALIMRDTLVVGRLLSLALMPLSKLFEYQILGPANHPVVQPVYVPKFLLAILRPVHTVKSFLPGNTGQPPAPIDPPIEKKE